MSATAVPLPWWRALETIDCDVHDRGRAVILGATGRNFAAGMSGGIAYVWNVNGDFDFFCNMEMVELSLIENSADERELKGLIETHLAHTSSPLAGRILADWPRYLQQFIKVMPIEYKKVLHDEKISVPFVRRSHMWSTIIRSNL